MPENIIHQKSINNAISAYLMLFISWLFIFNKKNDYINNDFVKSHTKIAFLIHLSFLINYLIFISYSFLKNIQIPFINYNLNYILANIIFTILFIMLLYWMYKASKRETLKISEILNIWKVEKIIDINWDWILDEKDKLTLILSYIPFIWYITQAEHYKEKNIKNIIKLNLYFSIILSLIYISDNKNIVLLFWLFYIIFAVFSSINIVAREKIISLNLEFIFSPTEIVIYFKAFLKYLYNYFRKKDFIDLSNISKIYLEKDKENETNNNELLKKLPYTKLNNLLIYIPFINLITIFFRQSNKKIHIINWVMITIFFIIFIILDYYNYISNSSYILLIFPIFFWYWYINTRPSYKIPIIYDLFEILNYIKNIFIKTKKTIKVKQSEIREETIKVWK